MVRDSRVEPSTVDADIVDSSMTRAGPSMLMLHIVEGSISQTHFPDPFRRPVPQTRTPPLSDPVPSIQYAGWHGTYH